MSFSTVRDKPPPSASGAGPSAGGPLACALVYGTAALERNGQIPLFRTPAMLGEASYSIYLWHTFAISVIAKAGATLALPAPLIFATSIGAGTIAGLCGYYLVERPLLRAAGRRKRRVGLKEAGVCTGAVVSEGLGKWRTERPPTYAAEPDYAVQ